MYEAVAVQFLNDVLRPFGSWATLLQAWSYSALGGEPGVHGNCACFFCPHNQGQPSDTASETTFSLLVVAAGPAFAGQPCDSSKSSPRDDVSKDGMFNWLDVLDP